MKVQKNDIFRKIIAVDILRMTELQKILTFCSRDYTHTHTHTHTHMHALETKQCGRKKAQKCWLSACKQTKNLGKTNKYFASKYYQAHFESLYKRHSQVKNWAKNKVKYQLNSYPNKKLKAKNVGTRKHSKRQKSEAANVKLETNATNVISNKYECDKRRKQQSVVSDKRRKQKNGVSNKMS